MIRFLQQDNRVTKILFAVIIGAAVISMVVYLIPGLMDNTTGTDATVYATVHEPGVVGRLFGESSPIKTTEVNQTAQRMLQQQRIPEQYMSFLLPQAMARAGQILVQRTILKQQADKMHLQVSDEDLRRELQTGSFAQYIFPNGQYIGDDAYINFVQNAFQTTRADFESEVKQDMELNRLQALITGGVVVSDNAVRAAYRVQGTKVKFDYAVISSDDLKKTINPSDADLQAFFKQNATRYATAVPETRKIQYAAFDASNIPGGKVQISDAEIQAYYAAHQKEYATPEQVKTRHILITSAAGADAKTDAAAKAKAQDILKQIKAGGNFAELAKQNSQDPGSKDSGGELPLISTSGLDPAYAKAAMALNPGQTSDVVKSAFGYHIIQTEQKQPAGVKSLAEEKESIVQILQQQKQGAAEQNFAQSLVTQAKKDGIDKMAAANKLHAVTTDYVGHDGQISGLSDAAPLLTQAFAAAKGAAPASVSTGDGYAVFQVVDVKPAHAPDFASYKSHILDDFREQSAPGLLASQLNKLIDRAKVLNDLKKASAEMNVPFKTSELVGHDGQVPDLGAMSGPAEVAFSLPKGAISGPINTGRTGAVLIVTDKQEPTPEDMAKNLEQTRDQLLNQQRDEIFRVYLGTLSLKYENAKSIRYTKQPTGPQSPLGS
jgi:peptidyl-prolyl cis-trans isomerase D